MQREQREGWQRVVQRSEEKIWAERGVAVGVTVVSLVKGEGDVR